MAPPKNSFYKRSRIPRNQIKSNYKTSRFKKLKMSSLKTNTDFSKKSRNKLNQLFSELRRLVEPYFSSVSDWNRFRIIDGAIALLTSMPLKQSSFQNNQPAQLSNKEA